MAKELLQGLKGEAMHSYAMVKLIFQVKKITEKNYNGNRSFG